MVHIKKRNIKKKKMDSTLETLLRVLGSWASPNFL